MRKTVAKRLRRQAVAMAAASPESSGRVARVMKRLRLGKTDSKGRDVIVDRITVRHTGFRRFYQALKRNHARPEPPPAAQPPHHAVEPPPACEEAKGAA